ncbi:Gfo/Idh/MocA family oxidoreductase [Catenulispora yoronensis]|uniref:Gfo/Idh/MocA family oxidoreductase n=1 Tax=Catenulispora yoronensis TaxID=450799 RepID=A0ABP5GS59_9ACTN
MSSPTTSGTASATEIAAGTSAGTSAKTSPGTGPGTSAPGTPPSPLRVGLVGYGLAGSAFHAPLIRATPGLELTAVVTSRPVPDDVVRVSSPDELWATGVDLAVVATPNRTHVPIATAALEAGVNVVVDKPLAATAAEAAALIGRARRAGLLLSVFQNRRWDGDFLTLSDLVASGKLGRVHRFESRFERWRPRLSGSWRESGDPADAGGLLNDLGSHLVDQALTLFGPARSVYAEVSALRTGATTDDDTFVALRHADGTHSHLWMSVLAEQPGPRFRVLGDGGSWLSAGLDSQEASLRAGGGPADPGFGANEPGSLNGKEYPTRAGSYVEFYEGIARALREGGPNPVDPADAVAMLKVLEAARLSAAEQRVVDLGE